MEILQIDKASTALVVIDLQKGILSLPVAPHSSETIVSNATKLAQAFRRNDMSVFLVHVDQSGGLRPISDRPLHRSGELPADWTDFIPELGPEKTDTIILKRQWGAFYGTDLELHLRRREIKTIVLCGISTSIGVESTARFAYEYGFQQIFVEDACGAGAKEEHENSVDRIFPRMGRVRSTKEVLDSLNS